VVSFVPLLVLALALLWIWKSNEVKAYYATKKKLETEKVGMIAENARLRGQLMDLKSISAIDKIVTEQFGLTQNVARRIIITDPVPTEKTDDKLNFASTKPDLTDWLEDIVANSSKVMADSPKPPAKGTK
jgi:hypothetical protein